ATLPDKSRLGEQVLVAISDDGGKTWPGHSVVFEDPNKKLGFFEQKLVQIAPGRVMATAWTVTLGDVRDKPNSYCISDDDGSTWGPVRSTGIDGQTLTPVHLGDNRLLVLYNRRYGRQAIVMGLVSFDNERWTVHHEGLLYDPQSTRNLADDQPDGLSELDSFAFGFPTAIRLHDNTLLATFWSKEQGICGIRWAKLRVDW
ncbi:MAG: exo-alpha-sialidase, partial [Pirellulales bacterium]|nr:exo-alpha-sialidase [Pirellulales bacterium]